MVGNAPGGEPRNHWKQGDTAESCIGGGAITCHMPPAAEQWRLGLQAPEANPSKRVPVCA